MNDHVLALLYLVLGNVMIVIFFTLKSSRGRGYSLVCWHSSQQYFSSWRRLGSFSSDEKNGFGEL